VVDVEFVPPLAMGRVPVTPEVKGSPVALVITPDAGVPRAGVTKVGEVNVPVALVSTKAEGVPKAGVVNTGEVKVLLVRVSVPVLVTRFVGVMMSDKLAMFS